MLAGKLLNVVSELPSREVGNSEAFKVVITGEEITGRKIYDDPVTFRPIAGNMFAANNLPPSADFSTGYWRRYEVICFRRNFDNDPNKNPHIAEEILAAERPEIVSWFAAGAARLRRAGHYTSVPSSAAAVSKWRKNADQIELFICDENIQHVSPVTSSSAPAAVSGTTSRARSS